ncbi:MAG: hypothetical protein HZB36_01620 [Candidatus Omnitrophica bacterium]|nr:hypothetical protein [Candidatus Omnitrophota bacterium]
MPESNLTPEEKLLRIIESPPGAMGQMRAPRRRQDFQLNLKLLRAKYGDRVKELLNLKAVNVALVFLGALATFFLAVDSWLGLPRKSVIEQLELLAKTQGVGDLAIERLDPLAVYLQEITPRNIFSLPTPAAQAPSGKTSAQLEAAAASLAADLKLVGIIWSDAPQAMIEDSKDGRTYLLNRGGKIKSGRVKDILKDRVILSYDDQEVELR